MNLGSIYYLLYIYIFFFQLSFLPALFNTRHRYMASQLLFSHVINLLSTKFGQDCTIKTTDWNFPRIAFNRGDTVHVQYMSATYVQRFWVNELSCYQLHNFVAYVRLLNIFLVYAIIWIILIFVAVGNKSLWRCQILWQHRVLYLAPCFNYCVTQTN